MRDKMRISFLPALTLLLSVSSSFADEKDEVLVRELAAVVRERLTPTWQRVEATKTLGKLGPRAALAVPELNAQLLKLRGEDTVPLQEAIVKALGQIGSAAKPAIPTLTRMAGREIDLDLALRRSIDEILSADERPDLNALLRLLASKDETQRLRAAKAFGRFASLPNPIITELRTLLTDPDCDVRRTTLATLMGLQVPLRTNELVNAYVLDLAEPDAANRWRAAKALGKLGKDDKSIGICWVIPDVVTF